MPKDSHAEAGKKKYLSITLLSFSLVIFSVAVCNFTIDPLAKFRVSDKIFYSSERELKPKLLEKWNFDGLVIGSSKITYIQTEDLAPYGRILNAGFSGARIEEMRYFLEELNPKVSWVGLGIDFDMFNNKNKYTQKDGKYFTPQLSDKIKYLISTDTLRYTIKTVSKNVRDKPSRYTSLGARNKKSDEQKDRDERAHLYAKAITFLKKSTSRPFALSDKRLTDLNHIQAWADQNNVKLICWTNPLEPGRAQLLSKWLGKNKELLLERFKSSCRNFTDLTHSYPDRKYFWNEHPVHYYPSTGKRFLIDHIFPLLALEKKTTAKIGNIKTR